MNYESIIFNEETLMLLKTAFLMAFDVFSILFCGSLVLGAIVIFIEFIKDKISKKST